MSGEGSAHDGQPADEAADLDDGLDRYPADEAEENIGYQKLAWYAAPFGDAAVGLLILAFISNALRGLGRAVIRLLIRWSRA